MMTMITDELTVSCCESSVIVTVPIHFYTTFGQSLVCGMFF